MIHQLYLKQVEAFKKLVDSLDVADGDVPDLLSSRHQDTIELIEAIRDWAVDKRQFATSCEQRAYTKVVAHLEEQLKLIQKEI